MSDYAALSNPTYGGPIGPEAAKFFEPFLVHSHLNRLRRSQHGGPPPLRLAYCATDFGVGTMRVTRIAERSISSETRGATSFFQ